ncbi:MAG: GIY-YIG nuclease family protein [Anaerolineaceae bacterium]|nr:GIY-YIG nuclease family protein [Anaerolineaceae bacterium]
MKHLIVDAQIPKEKGSYCLVFSLETQLFVQIGKLGCIQFEPGNYFYLGSAKGPGGLRARVKRHLRLEKKKFWHLDYLTPFLEFQYLIFTLQFEKECEWSQILESNYAEFTSVPRFGSSDCRRSCNSHLYMTEYSIDQKEISNLLNFKTRKLDQLFVFTNDSKKYGKINSGNLSWF